MKHSMTDIPSISLFGSPVHPLTMDETLDVIHRTILNRGRLQIGVLNVAKVVNMRRDEILKQDVLSSDLILADGLPLVWASRLLGRPLPARVTGIDLMFAMLQRGNEHGYAVYCLGATEEVSSMVAERIAREYPNVRLAGRRNGYFSEAKEEAIAHQIAESRPDILFVAISSPKKEKFLARWSGQIGVPICHGVGGSFDVMAGKVERAPDKWQRLGLEWLYRVKQEPGRLWRRYLVTNSIFCGMLISEFLSQREKQLSLRVDRRQH